MKTSPQIYRRQRAAFTLVELLVVIVIIAVLAALLLPALSSFRERGNQTKCLHQLKQWGNAIALYTGDNQGEIAWNSVFSVSNATPGPYQKYFQTAGSQLNMRWCPSVKWNYSGNPPVCYQFIRPNINGTPVAASSGLRLSGIPQPSQLMLMIDAKSPSSKQTIGASGDTLDTAVKPICVENSGVPIRHTGNVNALFADFHVQNVNWLRDLDPGSENGKLNQKTWLNITQ